MIPTAEEKEKLAELYEKLDTAIINDFSECMRKLANINDDVEQNNKAVEMVLEHYSKQDIPENIKEYLSFKLSAMLL